MICTIVACVETSSAVVGSSATTSAGWDEKARAISTRWHMPPESWNGWRRKNGVAELHLGQRLRHAPLPLLLRHAEPGEMLAELVADRQQRIERRQRLLRDEGDPVAQQAAERSVGEGEQVGLGAVRLPEGEAPARHSEALRQRSRQHAADHALARARLADEPQHLSGRDGEVDVAQHIHRLAAEARADGEPAGGERHHAVSVRVSTSLHRARGAARRRAG